MHNAHERFGMLEFTKRAKDTTTRVRVYLDRAILEPARADQNSANAHLISMIGGDAEIGALCAVIAEAALFRIQLPNNTNFSLSLGPEAQCFRGSMMVTGRTRPVRHLVAVSGYSIYVLRQASRRSWRIGQRLPVEVKFLHYAETMQESCLRLMGKKLLVSLAMEGKFSSEGLQAINEEDDILMAMARELVTKKGIGERADVVWSALQKKQGEVFAVKSSVAEPAAELVHNLGVAESEPSISPTSRLPSVTTFEPIPRKPSRRDAVPGDQLTLF